MSRQRSAFISEALGGDDEPSTPSSQDPIEDFGGDGEIITHTFRSTNYFQRTKNCHDGRNIAITLKFQIVHTYNHNGWLYLRCNRGARDRGKNRDLSVAQRQNTKTQYCGCKFLIKGYKVSGDEGWQIVLGPDAYGKHNNHELIVYEEGNRQMSKLSPGAKQLVRDLTDAKVKPQNILAAVQKQFPDDHPNRRHIYNFRDRLRLEEADGRAVVTYFFELGIESLYTHWSLVDPDTNVLTYVFMAHPTSLALLRTYSWVISIDSAYKTNKYKMSFLEFLGVTPCNMNFLIGYAFMKDESAASYVWVIDKLKLLIGSDVSLTTIITDCKLGLMTPIREIFPATAHLLCTWHIDKDVEHTVGKITDNKDQGKIFRLTRWNPILNAPH